MSRIPQVFNPQNGVTGGVWRDGDRIHKVLRATAETADQWQPSEDLRNWNYWRREELVYRSDLPARLGLIGPALLAVTDADDGASATLELAAVDGRTGADTTVDDLVVLAHRLGLSQATVRADDPWLSRNFLHDYTAARIVDWSLLTSEAAWRQDLIEPYFRSDIRDGLVALHDSASHLRALSLRLPRTVGHLDVFPANLFMVEGEPLLIDWAFVGDAALGEDIGNLIPDSIFDMFAPVSAVDEMCERIPAAYIAGLHEAGWTGDERLVHLGIMATGAAKYEWLAPRVLERAGAAVQASYGGVPVTDPRPNYAARAVGLGLCARWADEALGLARDLGL